MFASGFFLLVGSASVSAVYGVQETLAVLIARVAPGFLGALHSLFSRLGGGDFWRDYMMPAFDQPAWMVFAGLGCLLLLLGLIRRV